MTDAVKMRVATVLRLSLWRKMTIYAQNCLFSWDSREGEKVQMWNVGQQTQDLLLSPSMFLGEVQFTIMLMNTVTFPFPTLVSFSTMIWLMSCESSFNRFQHNFSILCHLIGRALWNRNKCSTQWINNDILKETREKKGKKKQNHMSLSKKKDFGGKNIWLLTFNSEAPQTRQMELQKNKII